MEAKELRIGNYVYYKNTNDFAKVELIHSKHFDCRDEYGSFTPNGIYEPIPLTEERLQKCGFQSVKIGRTKHLELCIGNIKLLFFGNIIRLGILGVSQYEWSSIVNIKYLHQLQNLYFTLTGEELQFKL